MGDELLFENVRTRIWRTAGDGNGAGTICKEFLGQESDRRLEHESMVLRRLEGVSGTPTLLRLDDARSALVLADDDASALPPGPWEIGRLLDVAVSLTEVIAAVHARGVVHKDINPTNVMMSGAGAAVLLDYDLATTFPLDKPRFTHHADIAGTLNYLAPEQSGRTSWPVDQRADLYAFGATLYEWATGAPPFDEGDPLRLVHAHLTQVPRAPSSQRPGLPQVLQEIILRLLQKDPERRYQSAEGLLHDLRRLRDLVAAGQEAAFALGERDFAFELAAPTHAVGRQDAVDTLHDAFMASVTGGCRAVLVSGPAGVGKTTVIDELRLPVTSANGWFVSGKFDQYRQDADGLRDAFRALGAMVLAEPENELIAIRHRLIEALGANAGLVAWFLPEFAVLLQVEPVGDDGDSLRTGQRLQQCGLQILRALAGPRRPIVLVVDGLQWAHSAMIEVISAVVRDSTLTGVLVVGAYRDAEVDAAHPLSAAMAQWQSQVTPPPHVRLENLASTDVARLIREMLRAPVEGMDQLVEAIAVRTGGNPCQTLELLNALRRAQALRSTAQGWAFDAARMEDLPGHSGVLALLADRVAHQPGETRDLLESLSCLGGEAGLDVLIPVAGPEASSAVVVRLLTPALETGLLLLDTAERVVRFRHDRARHAVYEGMSSEHRVRRHLGIARHLMGEAGLRMLAAEQYYAALAAVSDPAEAVRVAELFREAAGHARQMANHPVVERYLRAALGLIGPDAPALRWPLEGECQTALIALGRFDEAALIQHRIADHCPDLMLRTAAARMQMIALLLQHRPAEALDLGCRTLNGLGLPVPSGDDLARQTGSCHDELAVWAAQTSAERAEPPLVPDPATDAMCLILNTIVQSALFIGSPLLPWLILAAARIWSRHGPSLALLGPLSHAPFVTAGHRDGFRTGHDVVRQVLAAAERIDHEPESSFVRFVYALTCGPWFDPVQEPLQMAREAHERLARAGDLYSAGCTYSVSVPLMLEFSDTLGAYQAEIGRGLQFAAATGNHQFEDFLGAHQALVSRLTGTVQPPPAAAPGPPGAANPAVPTDDADATDVAWQVTHALAAALLNDPIALARHAPQAVALISYYEAIPSVMPAHLVQALNLAIQAQQAGDGQLLAGFDQHRDWVARRAHDAPGNFSHLVAWLDAERAWARNEFETAIRAFDAAQREVDARQRPWHRAIIAERRARFLLQHGLEHAGRAAVREAYSRYEQWGALQKTAGLRSEFPFLTAVDTRLSAGTSHPTTDHRQSTVWSQNIDVLAVLRASQAISSQTRLDRLTDQVAQVLCELTGATSARLLLRDSRTAAWLLQLANGQTQPVDVAVAAGVLPATVIRYVERTGEPLLVDDATRDDRFAQDPYLRRLQQCALLALPVLGAGEMTAMLLLENDDTRGAFGSNRLDTVLLLAGQLTVSLRNARLYRALEDKVGERTQALEAANAQLELLADTDPLTGLPNRRHLTKTLQRQWQVEVRRGRPVSIAMIDIDHFKKYNDHYGHPAGDECLRLVSDAIRRSVRDSDVVIRYGGEEFIIVLAGADEQAAAQVAERVREAVAGLALPHERSASTVVTVSIGVATSGTVAVTSDELLGTADALLYESKNSGRNRVTTGIHR